MWGLSSISFLYESAIFNAVCYIFNFQGFLQETLLHHILCIITKQTVGIVIFTVLISQI